MQTCTCSTPLRDQLNAVRYQHIMTAAIVAAGRLGFHKVTRADIALEAKVSPPLVSRYLGDMDAIRNLVMGAAIDRGILNLVAQGLAAQHPAALDAPPELRAQAVGSLA